MQDDSVHPSKYTFVALLKACARLTDVERGREMHAEVARLELEGVPFVGNTLVDMYTKCGSFAKAREVFDKLSIRDVVSWTALIAGYAEHRHGEEALNCFKQMQLEGVSPDAFTFACSLKACGSIKAIAQGREIHVMIVRQELEGDPFVGNTLVDMYARCGSFAKAQEVFDKLPARDVVSWNVLIAGYAERGLGERALNCFEQALLEGVRPDALMFVCSLKACGSTGAIDKGQEIHAEIARRELERAPFVGNTMVDMYAKCGLFTKAHEMFDNLPVRDVVSWNVLIAGYAEHGLGKEAVNCFEQMQLEGISPDAFTFVCSLKACGSIGAIDKGRKIHTEIARQELEREAFVGNTLVDMYAKCGSLAKAQEVFAKLPVLDVVSWSALIAGCADHGLGEEALYLFEMMQVEGISPDVFTFICSLKACGSIDAIDRGQAIHSDIARQHLERDPLVGSALVDMYAKCGWLVKARELFDNLQARDVVSWNILIAGYVGHGMGEEALMCYEQMHLEGVFPNAFTFNCSLKTCGILGAVNKGQEIHTELARQELDSDSCVGSTLVDMYAKCGMLAKAREVFDKLLVRDDLSWNRLIAGYAEHGLGEEALNCFKQMQLEGIPPDAFTYVCSLKACGNIGAIDKGEEIHVEIAIQELERNPFVGNTLVDMYAKCGLLTKAQEVFDTLPVRDVVSWSALIAGYAEHGLGEQALHCFEKMQLQGVSPDVFTFVCSLKACGSIGALAKGREIHKYIVRQELEKAPFVGNSLVDMYAKCGLLEKAREVFDRLPVQDVIGWTALIAGYVERGLNEEALNYFEQMQLGVPVPML